MCSLSSFLSRRTECKKTCLIQVAWKFTPTCRETWKIIRYISRIYFYVLVLRQEHFSTAHLQRCAKSSISHREFLERGTVSRNGNTWAKCLHLSQSLTLDSSIYPLVFSSKSLKSFDNDTRLRSSGVWIIFVNWPHMYECPTLSNSQLEGEPTFIFFTREPAFVRSSSEVVLIRVLASFHRLYDTFPRCSTLTLRTPFQEWNFKTARWK